MLVAFCLMVWWLAGMAGCSMVWAGGVWFDAHLARRRPDFCPAPLDIIKILIGGAAFGALSLLVGLIFLYTTYVTITPRPTDWWHRPICKKKPQ